ncbi:WG repeat-containing protein [Halalkalibacterium ligniniphilum]
MKSQILLFLVLESQKQNWTVISTKGNFVITPQFDQAFDFSEGLGKVSM